MSDLLIEHESAAAQLNRQLRARLAEVVCLDTLRQLSNLAQLSSLFVPAVSDAYLASSTRLMIVGRETAGWGKGLASDLAHHKDTSDIETYLEHQMNYHQRKVVKVAARSKFFQFYREASRAVEAPGCGSLNSAPIWANLFCFDSAGKQPGRPDLQASPEHSAAIVRLSLALLKIQISVLQPKIIVFTTGTSCDRYLHELRDAFGQRLESTRLIPKQLWRFYIPVHGTGDTDVGRPLPTLAYRTPHPRHSATSSIRSAILADIRVPGSLTGHLQRSYTSP